MKEENKTKKTTAKKSTAKKTSTKKTNTKKVASTKTTTTKKVTPKKTSSTKKTAPKKTTSAPKKRIISVVTNEELVKNEKVVENKTTEINNEVTYNKELLLRMILIIAYTLIIAILMMGFIESYTKDLKVESNYKPSYIVTENILDEKNILKLENAKYTLGELDGDYFVYVGYTKINNNKVYNLDREISTLINKYDLKDKFYYINIDSIIEEKNYVDLVNKYLGYTDVLVSKVPTILYVNSDNIIRIENIITREDDKIITSGDFQKLLDINQFVAKK